MIRIDVEASAPGQRVADLYMAGIGWMAMEKKTWRDKRYRLEFIGKERPTDIINTLKWNFDKETYPQIYIHPSKTQRRVYFDTENLDMVVLCLMSSHLCLYTLIRSAYR